MILWLLNELVAGFYLLTFIALGYANCKFKVTKLHAVT